MQFDRRVAQLQALVGDVEVLLDRWERHRRGVGRDFGPEPAQHFVNGHPEGLAGKVVQSDVHQAEDVDRELLDPVELPDPVPQPLPPQRVLADELVAQPAVDEVFEDDPAARLRQALHALVGGDPQQAPFELGLGTRQPGAPHERRCAGWDAEPLNFDPGYFHELPLSLWADVDNCSLATILRRSSGPPKLSEGRRLPLPT